MKNRAKGDKDKTKGITDNQENSSPQGIEVDEKDMFKSTNEIHVAPLKVNEENSWGPRNSNRKGGQKKDTKIEIPLKIGRESSEKSKKKSKSRKSIA